MIQIEDALVSFDIFEKKFCCDLTRCKGVCCIEGDSGAPLDVEEPKRIAENYEGIQLYMKPAGVEAVASQGFSIMDRDGDLVTPLIDNRECAYAIEEDGMCWCAIEKAWKEGKSTFRKPLSCFLYPIRITRYEGFEALNYNRWEICSCACKLGEQKGIPLYLFLKEALITKYGVEWYEQLEYAAHEIEQGHIEIPPR